MTKSILQTAAVSRWSILTAMLLVLCSIVPCHGERRRGSSRGGVRPNNRSTAPQPAAPVVATPSRKPAPAFRADQEGTTKYALVIALREYPQANSLASLPGTDRDALRLVAALRNGGYSEQNIVLVYDDAEKPELRPTRANILAALAGVLARAKAGTSVAVFATGHGIALQKVSYLCPSDATDAALSDPQQAAQQLIAIGQIATQMSQKCQADHKLLVIDACRDTTNDRTSDYVVNVADLEQPAEGVWLMSSCSNSQFSWMSDRVHPGERRALFSHFVAEGLAGAADLLGDNDGRVGLFELYTYAFVKTRAAAQEIKQTQTPELFGLASPFTLATTGTFVARRTLTTSDPVSEARRSALHLADDVVLDLRAADAEYRQVVTGEKASPTSIRDASRVLHQYLCHLLGNRIQASLTFDPDCKLAHVAQGLCYRTCGMYEEALTGFLKGGESLDLFVKAKADMKKHYIAHDESGKFIKEEKGNLVLRIAGEEETGVDDKKTEEDKKREKFGTAVLYAQPDGKKPQQEVLRESMVRITKIEGPWLFVSAVNDVALPQGGWINREEVHWFPEAIDLYAPSSPMRPASGAVTRLDYASSGLNAVAQRLALPAERLESVAIPFDNLGRRIRIGGRLPPWVGIIPYANTAIYYANLPSYFAGLPAGWIRQAASYVRIPSNYVAMVGGYAAMAGSYAHTAQFWAGAANEYYDGNDRSQKLEKDRQDLNASGDLEPVKRRPISLGRTPWGSRRADSATGGATQP